MPDLTLLGNKVDIPKNPADAVLETIEIKQESLGSYGVVRFSCPEFTSLCPKTGQPDFAKIYIDYVPGRLLVESKALKLFLASYRNHGAFHESVTVEIFDRLRIALKPRWIRISAFWFARGGIPIDVFLQSGEQPKGYYIPPLTALHAFSYDGR